MCFMTSSFEVGCKDEELHYRACQYNFAHEADPHCMLINIYYIALS